MPTKLPGTSKLRTVRLMGVAILMVGLLGGMYSMQYLLDSNASKAVEVPKLTARQVLQNLGKSKVSSMSDSQVTTALTSLSEVNKNMYRDYGTRTQVALDTLTASAAWEAGSDADKDAMVQATLKPILTEAYEKYSSNWSGLLAEAGSQDARALAAVSPSPSQTSTPTPTPKPSPKYTFGNISITPLPGGPFSGGNHEISFGGSGGWYAGSTCGTYGLIHGGPSGGFGGFYGAPGGSGDNVIGIGWGGQIGSGHLIVGFDIPNKRAFVACKIASFNF